MNFRHGRWESRSSFDGATTMHVALERDGRELGRSATFLALSLERDHPACAVGPITRVRDAQDCHDVMRWIATAHGEATGVTTVYHEHEDDLLTQVRAVLRT